MKKQPAWLDSFEPPDFPELDGRVETDVLVLGAGITGLTTAYLLHKAGRRVVLVDRQGIGGGETGHTTAHVTFVTDTRLHELVSQAGEDKARSLWDAGRAAMRQIESLAGELRMECELRTIPACLFASLDADAGSETEFLKRDYELAVKLGFDASFVQEDPLFHRPAVRFPNQLKFHPLKYVSALAAALKENGCPIFCHTGGAIDGEKHELNGSHGSVHYGTLVSATHVPVQGGRGILGASLFQTKLAAYSTYAIEAEIEPVHESLFWDTDNPYHYFRVDRRDGRCTVIFGGEDHKTGQDEETEARYERLAQALLIAFPGARLLRRWSGQVIETPDGFPYIGEAGDRQFVATGFSGNGMTFGTLSGILIADLIMGKADPWNGLFSPHRKSLSGAWTYLAENKDFPVHFVKDRLTAASSGEDVRPNSGSIVRKDGSMLAVYCDEHGKQSVLSAICPHMGCIVSWNGAEKTWDCPCHGSRFSPEGEVIAGPAESTLAPHHSG